MCKKIAIVAVAVVAGLILLNKTSIGSYVGFGWKKGKELFKQQVPPEVQVERLRYELTQLDPEIKKARRTLAEEAVAVEDLRKDVAKTQRGLEERLREILAVRTDVESDASKLNYNGREYPAAVVRSRLAMDWESYKRTEEALKSKVKLLEARELALADGHKQLAGMTGLKDQLQAELDQVEAELKTLRLAQTRNNIQIDNTRITRFKDSLAELQRRIKVETRVMEYEGVPTNHTAAFEKPVDVAEKALKEIDARFPDKVARSC